MQTSGRPPSPGALLQGLAVPAPGPAPAAGYPPPGHLGHPNPHPAPGPEGGDAPGLREARPHLPAAYSETVRQLRAMAMLAPPAVPRRRPPPPPPPEEEEEEEEVPEAAGADAAGAEAAGEAERAGGRAREEEEPAPGGGGGHPAAAAALPAAEGQCFTLPWDGETCIELYRGGGEPLHMAMAVEGERVLVTVSRA